MSASKVWSRFTAKKADGTELKLRIEDAVESCAEEIKDFIFKHFIGNEAFRKGAGIMKNKDAVKEYGNLLQMLLSDENTHIALCVEDKPTISPIIGISAMQLYTNNCKDELEKMASMVKTPEMAKLLEIATTLEALYDEMAVLKLNKYYSGLGITVDPAFRRMGIASEFIKVRPEIGKEDDVQAVGATMTAIGTQKAADKYGWKTVYEISFEDLGKKVGVQFVDVPVMCKKMVYHMK